MVQGLASEQTLLSWGMFTQSPVGAGDALLSGLIWALEHGLSLEEVARWGVAVGTAAAIQEGVGVGTRAEVEMLYGNVQVGNASMTWEGKD